MFASLHVSGLQLAAGRSGPYIIASNHVSELDPLLIVSALPFFSRHLPLFYVAREKNFYSVNWRSAVYGGKFFKLMGAYPGYTGLHNYEQALRHHLALLAGGRSIGIFPMGGIRPRGAALEPRGGVIYLSHATGVPILPVSITGAHDLTYSDFFLRRRKIGLVFGKPVQARELLDNPDGVLTPTNYRECEAASRKLMQLIAELG